VVRTGDAGHLPPLRRCQRVKVPAGTFGDALRQRRWRARLEQVDVAAQFGVSKDTYRNWEMNRRKPSPRYSYLVRGWMDS
jgi:DNA-binding transcriptional regulator YiaG